MLTTVSPYFKARRDRLLKEYPAYLFPANPSFIRNSDVYYPYRQESSFYYLSGEPHSFLVLLSNKTTPI